jgi:protoporphyrinogen oxidase
LRIGIIGAGITGLTAAYKLSKQGHLVSIFESSDTIGGLAAGIKLDNCYIEKAYHHFFASDKYLIELTEELRLQKNILWLDSSTAIYDNDKFYSFTSAKDLISFTPLNFLDRIRTGLVFLYLKYYTKWKNLENTTAKEWLIRWNGQKAFSRLWEPILKGKFHKFYDQISMAWFWARIHSRASSKKINSEKLGYFEGGFQIIIDKLTKNIIQNGGNVLIKNSVQEIRQQEMLIIDEFGQEYKFDKIISTTPSHVFAKHITKFSDKNYLDKLNSVDYIGAITIIFQSEIKLTDYYWTNINDSKAPFLALINHTKMTGLEMYTDNSDSTKKHIYYLGGYFPHDSEMFRKDSTQILDEWIEYLAKITNTTDLKNSIVNAQVFKFKNAQHIVDRNYGDRIVSSTTPFDNIYLSNFSLIYPWDRGTNWAVCEGKKLAELI